MHHQTSKRQLTKIQWARWLAPLDPSAEVHPLQEQQGKQAEEYSAASYCRVLSALSWSEFSTELLAIDAQPRDLSECSPTKNYVLHLYCTVPVAWAIPEYHLHCLICKDRIRKKFTVISFFFPLLSLARNQPLKCGQENNGLSFLPVLEYPLPV